MARRLWVFCFEVFCLGLGLLGRAEAQPTVCGNQQALGSWSLGSCPVLKDDGVAPDAVAGDGIYTVAVQLMATPLLEYKLLPNGVWDNTQIQANGTCAATGGSSSNPTQNIQVVNPNVCSQTLFFYDSRALPAPTYAPAPGNRSGGDSVMIDAPAGTCPSFLAVGDFQDLYGPNSSAATLSLQGPGLLVGHVTASKSLATGWRWKVMEQTTGVVREYGPSGWAYAPCEADFATVSEAAAPGNELYFLFHAQGGRLQTLVASAPLDGFSPGGVANCQPSSGSACSPLDMGADLDDMGLPPGADLGHGNAADGAVAHGRPGIHCDCQIGRPVTAEDSSSPCSSASLLVIVVMGASIHVLRRQLRGQALQGQS